MPDRAAPSRPPLVLIANDQEWSTRSLESILGPSGYAVLRAYTGPNAIERARSAQPDVIILDANLPESDGFTTCRTLRDDALITPSTPIIITTPGPTPRQQRLQALRAGANEFLGQPVDAEEFPLRLNAYVRAKFDADRAREEGLVDQPTGLYNVRGLARRARELGSQAFRHHAALGCVVFSADLNPADAADSQATEDALVAAVQHLATVLRNTGRVSDAIGRLGPTEFAVIAPETDSAGAVKLAQRLSRALEESAAGGNGGGSGTKRLKLRAGYHAVPNVHEASLDPVDLLVHATTALRMSKADPEGQWLRPFENRVSLA